eukprot:496496-Rhodomonas_salina.3
MGRIVSASFSSGSHPSLAGAAVANVGPTAGVLVLNLRVHRRGVVARGGALEAGGTAPQADRGADT